ncbi:MAG: anaerobic ribonucleoside-triphosphate reductase activating protein [Candidatus Pacebacteria bacterium]|nr:anaerobic ribonucleoside-triphosphate reductase activating protein [Candidatus Paceibacterota bacterium]MDD3919256.1 anaerobic ribonucleoside-triphosphate reductase activating protein [Candidatus Paceibacterota bacterium]
MKIGGLQKTTLLDYPGEIACVVFLTGCNFRCPFCYSKELVEEDLDLLELVREEEFFSFLKKRKGQLGACVICGGEPTLNKDLLDFSKKIKELGFKVKLDTNGSNPEMIEKLIKEKVLDYIAMDIKAPFDKYEKATKVKVDISKIKKSIELIKNSGIDYEFRTTIVPTIHELKDIYEMVNQIAPAQKYFLQIFRKDKELLSHELDDVLPFDEKEIKKIIEEIKSNFEICNLR